MYFMMKAQDFSFSFSGVQNYFEQQVMQMNEL